MARTVALASLLVFLASAWAGCILVRDGTPLDVPPIKAGDRYAAFLNQTGKEVSYTFSSGDEEPTASIDDRDDHYTTIHEVARVPDAKDAFLRGFNGVQLRTQLLGRSSGQVTLDKVVTSDVYEEATALPQYTEFYLKGSYSFSGRTTPIEVRQLNWLRHEDQVAAGWGDLAGHRLVLGESVDFTQNITFLGGGKYRITLHLTPVEEARIGGERAFGIEPTYGVEELERPTRSLPAPSTSGAKDLTPWTTMPESYARLWYTARCAYPVREESHTPFGFKHEWYWQNSTTEATECTPGQSAVHWGTGTALPLLDRMPGAKTVKASELITAGPSGFRYGLSTAWQNLQNDATLTTFQSFMQNNPGAYPFYSGYHVDDGHKAFTWHFTVGAEQRREEVETRLQVVADASPVAVTQNQQNQGFLFGSFGRPLSKEELEAQDVTTVADAAKLYRMFRPGASEVSASIEVANHSFLMYDLPPVFQAAFFDLTKMSTITPPTGGSEAWVSHDPVAVDLRDGGLRGINVTTSFGIDRWPWTSVPHPSNGNGAPMPGSGLAAGPLGRMVGLLNNLEAATPTELRAVGLLPGEVLT